VVCWGGTTMLATLSGCRGERELGEKQVNAGLAVRPKVSAVPPPSKKPGCQWRGPAADAFYYRWVSAQDGTDSFHQLWYGAGSWDQLAKRVAAQPKRNVDVSRDGEPRFSLSFDDEGRPLRRTDPDGGYIEATYVEDRLTREVVHLSDGGTGYWATYVQTPETHCIKHDIEGWGREVWRDESYVYVREHEGAKPERYTFDGQRFRWYGTTRVYDDDGRVVELVGGYGVDAFTYDVEVTTVNRRFDDETWTETIELDEKGLPTRWAAKDHTWTYAWK